MTAAQQWPGVDGGLVAVGDTALWVVGRGRPDGVPLLVLHGGPGDDHHEFGDYLDPLGDLVPLLLVDQRAQGRSPRDSDPATWTLRQMAADVPALAATLGVPRYAVLGHSYGAMVTLQLLADTARDAAGGPTAPAAAVVSHGVAAVSWLAGVSDELATFTPEHLRAQVAASWAAEETVGSAAEFGQLMHDQLPFHFADPLDPRIAEYEARTAGTIYGFEVLRAMAPDYGAIDVTAALPAVRTPTLVLGGRHDRVCPAAAAAEIAALIPAAELEIFEDSAHMSFVEQTPAYLATVAAFLHRTGLVSG